MLFTSASIISLLAVVPAAVQAVPVFSHSDGLFPRQAADLQTKLELDISQVATGSQQDGQGADVADNQVRSKTSFNNFANFCLTQTDVPITDGQQIKTGSCNPTIMGVIASTSNMPRSKFEFPKNGEIIKSNQPFTLRMKISNLQTGNFVNPQTNYYAAPQFVNGGGDIVGHSHVTIQKMDDAASPKPLDPSIFAFFKGLNGVANGGILTADVPAPGLPDGFYRMCSINTAANHQPVLVAVAQHGSLDDCVYFQCAPEASNDLFFNKGQGNNNGGQGANNGGQGANNGGQGANNGGQGANNGGQGANNGGQGNNNGGQGANNGGQGANNGGQGANNGGQGANNGGQGANNGGQGANNGGQGNNNGGQGQGQNNNNGGQKGGQGNNGGAVNNNQGGNNNQGQAAQLAADKAKQEADAKKAAEDQKKAEEASKAAANANAGQAAAQQAADKAKQEADAKKAAEDQKKAQQQSNNRGGRNRRSLRFQRD